MEIKEYSATAFFDTFDFFYGKDENGFYLIDNQGANLGNIESERFDTMDAMVQRIADSIYMDDYIVTDLEEEYDYDGDCSISDMLAYAEEHDVPYADLLYVCEHPDILVDDRSEVLLAQKLELLAQKLDAFAYEYDTYGYMDNLEVGETREDAVAKVVADIENGKAADYISFLEGIANDVDEDDKTISEAKYLVSEIKSITGYELTFVEESKDNRSVENNAVDISEILNDIYGQAMEVIDALENKNDPTIGQEI